MIQPFGGMGLRAVHRRGHRLPKPDPRPPGQRPGRWRAAVFAGVLAAAWMPALAAPPARAAGPDPITRAATSGKAFVLAEFVSDTCPACEQMQPVVRSVVVRFPHLIHQIHDADLQVELAKKYEVRCVPVYVVVDPEGQVRFNDVGLFTADELDEILRGAGAVSQEPRGN